MSATVLHSGLAIAIALALGGCGDGAGEVPGGATAGRTVVNIEATDGFAFSPDHLTVAAGTTVRWTNKGAIPHTITSGTSSQAADHPGALADHPLPSGAVFELTLNTAGDWPYFCRYHEGMGMVGTVTVTAGDSPPPPAGNQSRSAAVLSDEAKQAGLTAQIQQLGR
jgi:plastocyanin